ncbi:MAG: prepilin peptidase [Erysipelotrichia bacterium]|nr:prepilin peptidase [Erysipelotrichia bacterium]NCC55579.1 prepilin peptidase [Erysipelotrichia bacterium]
MNITLEVIIMYVLSFFIGAIYNDVIDLILYKCRGKEVCPHCHHPLKWQDKLPVVSYLFHLGRCRYCKHKLDARYPLIEMSGVINFLFVYSLYGDQVKGLFYFCLLSVMMILSVVDMKTHHIPLKAMGIIACLAILLAFTTNEIVWLDRICAIFIVSIPLLVIYKLKANSIGEADILFSSCMGFLLGMWGIIFTMCFAYLLAGLYALMMLLLKKMNRKSKIAMFPFFYISLVIYLVHFVDFVSISLR